MFNFSRNDLLVGMHIVVRNGSCGVIVTARDFRQVSSGWISIMWYKLSGRDLNQLEENYMNVGIRYADDLTFSDSKDLDIMKVSLPSGFVLYERPITRVFSKDLFLQHADQTNWDRNDPVLQVLGDTLDGKEIQFIGTEESAMSDGIPVSIKWTRLAQEGDK